jgi:hypothetical protein
VYEPQDYQMGRCDQASGVPMVPLERGQCTVSRTTVQVNLKIVAK